MNETAEAAYGFFLWALFLYPIWSPRMRRIRKGKRKVSGNGQAWEQDEPFDECFDEQEDQRADAESDALLDLGMEDDL